MGEEGGVYHAARLRRDSRVEADDIAGRKQFPERELSYGKGLFRFRIFSMGGIIKKLASEAVSYTHLDVYKRQISHGTAHCNIAGANS